MFIVLPQVSLSTDVVDVQETRADVEALREEETAGEAIPDETIAGATVAPPPQRVEPVLEGVLPEDVATELRDNVKEVYMIPGYVYPEYEPSVVEKFRFETQVREHPPTEEELVRMHELKMQAMAARQEVTRQEQVRLETAQAQVSRTQTQVVKMKVEATAAQQQQKQVEIEVAKQQTTKPEVVTMATEMASQIVRAVQEVTEEREQVIESHRETVEIVTKPKVEKHVRIVETTTEIESQPKPQEVAAVSLLAPVFEIPLCDVTVVDGEKATLECRVSAQPTPEITWYCENQEIKTSQDFRILYEEGMCTLDIMDVLPDDEGEYKVKAVNEAGTCETTAYLTVLRELPPHRLVLFCRRRLLVTRGKGRG